MIKMFGLGRRLPREKILRLYEKGDFQTENRPSKLIKLFGSQKERLSIESMQKIEDILETIQGTDCAACGAPDCRTFAEDIIRGNARIKDCLWVRAQGKKKTG
jgi:hypothetical protein